MRSQNNFKAFEKGGRYKTNLPDYLKQFLKPDVQERKIDFRSYDIHLYYARGGRGYAQIGGLLFGVSYGEIYFDSTFSFILLKDKKAICTIAFEKVILPQETFVLVKQIQGVKGKQEELSPFRWEKMLLKLLIDWANRAGIERIEVTQSIKSEYYSDSNEERKKRLHLKYDVTAQRMGFKLNKRRGVYSLYLKQKNSK